MGKRYRLPKNKHDFQELIMDREDRQIDPRERTEDQVVEMFNKTRRPENRIQKAIGKIADFFNPERE